MFFLLRVPVEKGLHDIRSVDENTLDTAHRRFIIAFDILYIVGPVLLLAIILTTWWSHQLYSRRHSMWFTAVASWVILGISNIFLLGQQVGAPPRHSTCLVQAMLIYASPTLCAFSAVAFLFQTYLHLSVPRNFSPPLIWTISFYVVSYTVPIAILIEVLVLGVANPPMVRRDPSGMYCNLSSLTPRKVTGGAIMCALVTVLLLEALIAMESRRVSRERSESIKIDDYRRQNASGDVIARIMAFTLCVFIALSVSFIQYLPYHITIDNAKVNLVQAALPCCAALIFGTQQDILRVWIPWKEANNASLGTI